MLFQVPMPKCTLPKHLISNVTRRARSLQAFFLRTLLDYIPVYVSWATATKVNITYLLLLLDLNKTLCKYIILLNLRTEKYSEHGVCVMRDTDCSLGERTYAYVLHTIWFS